MPTRIFLEIGAINERRRIANTLLKKKNRELKRMWNH